MTISYTDFLANVNTDDLAMLTSFICNVDVEAQTDATLADTLFTQATRLDSAGLLTEMHRVYSHDANGNLLQSFRGVVTPQAASYVAQLARERVVLSREPLP
ncbi:MAG TPA: hypothetical protein VFH59_07845 [Frateuria sp.]|uniref:hypothetical protein n=1 Tax=Frateuria sp. TaxID=2211372 RepID=UPI002D7FC49A|nr:hypothetical protein [Frateuria sp.]HET6805334.1 hypothetical protein [Frateuria sp.]